MAIPRVDEALVTHGFADSIDEARLLVMEGKVYLGGGMVAKPSDKLRGDLVLSVRGPKRRYVSRGGLKLEKALRVFGISVSGKTCVDIGASTGGFTDVMLTNLACRVYCVDVGFGLLDWSIRNDPRAVVMERTNARFLRRDMFSPLPSFGATDVSFISLKAVLPKAFEILDGERDFVALVKPQFEARREQVAAKGIVRSREVHLEVIMGIVEFVTDKGWVARGLDYSPITGTDGNIEFLLHIAPSGTPVTESDALSCVESAWREHRDNI